MIEPRILLDSNLCIYVLQGVSEPVRQRLETFEPGAVVTSAIAHAEVMHRIDPADVDGYRRAKMFFDAVPVLPFDEKAALAYRDVPFRRRSFDRLIAAHALSLGLTVATNNEADFADVPGLAIENWTR